MPPQPAWLLLQRHPRFHDGAIAVDANPPPGAAELFLPFDRLKASIPQGDPLILCADKLGALLVAFREPGNYPDLCIVTVAKDAPAASISALPHRKPPVHQIASLTNIGIIPAAGSATDLVVAELQTVRSTDRARIITFTTEDGEWKEKKLHIPKVHSCRAWGRHGVLSHAGLLWAADLAWGLVCCDPSHSAPTLRFVELPPGSALGFDNHPAIEGRRAVCVSDSRIRYVEISRIGDGPSRITMWNLHASRNGWEWMKSEEARFADIWASEGYRRTRLPAIVPTIVLLDPIVPAMVCFCLGDYLFCLHFGSKHLRWVRRLPRDQDSLIAWQLGCPIISLPAAPALPLPWRATGSVLVRGFECHIFSSSDSCTAFVVHGLAGKRTTFRIMLWHRSYKIGQLVMEEQYNGSGSVSYHQSSALVASAVLPVVVSSIKRFLLYVPLPYIDKIFSLFSISPSAGKGCAPRDSGTILGSLVDGNKEIIFKETNQEDQSLMLECHIGDIEPFGVLLQTSARFHSLTIVRSLDRSTTTVKLQVDKNGPELKTCIDFPVYTNIPLPYLPRIAAISSD